MSNLKDLNVNILEDLDLAHLKIDLPSKQESLEFQSNDYVMDKEEMEFALSCVMNIKKNLVNAISANQKESLQDQLVYVNELIFDAGLEASSL